MATNTAKKIFQAQLGAADAALFTGTAAHTYTFTGIVICNTDTASRTFRLHAVDSAGSSTASNALFYDISIAANSTITFDRMVILVGTEMVRGLADSASKITVTGFGIDTA
jgi:hypothetical protein